jgi:hypothetical protein
MPESTLAATWDELRQRVAFDRGFGAEKTNWTPEQITILEMVMRSGARLFYKPRPVSGPPHEWSFLKPPFDLLLPALQDDVDLPADFGFLVGDLYFVDPTTWWSVPIERKNDGEIMLFRQRGPNITSRPTFCATVPNEGPGVTKGQRSVLMLYPRPNQDYMVQGRYSVLPEALEPSHPHPYGGAAHAETLIQACLAASEQLNGTPGPHSAHFAECLASSIEYDRRVVTQSIDNKDGRRRGWMGGRHTNYNANGMVTPFVSLTTYNGQY